MDHPRQIGRYHIISVLGEGGMGVVYHAEQRVPVRRTVAVKLIKLGMDTRDVIARFESERQALAMMNHPNVAKVFDAGATDLGRPYFVMEFVNGVPITSYCDQQNLAIRDRLKLFVQACHAIEHAHQKALIHRDLKPSNILVMLEDGQPLVKVIDFGVAKATNQRLTERTLFTERGQLIGTPEYMSPEQAEMSELDVDTRTDIYSLGVVLYELLAGALPFDSRTLRSAAYNEVHRIIRDTDPPRPSTRLSSLGAAAADVARRRRTQLAALSRELRSELEWIPLKAMQKERARRYRTASEFAQDIDNYLDNRPLIAGPESAGYRVQKFLRRNRGPVTAAAAVVAVFVLGAAGMTWQAIRATRAEKQAKGAQVVAEQRRVVAENNAATVTAVNDFLARMLGSVDPAHALGREVTVREVLDDAAQRIGTELANSPVVEAQLRLTIGRTYRSLGRSEDALPHLKRALELASQHLGEDSETSLLALDHIGVILVDRGRFAEAEPMLRRQVELAKRKHGADAAPTLYAMNSLAMCLQSQDRFAQAEPLYRQVVHGLTQILGPKHGDVVLIESNLAFLIAQLGRLDEAEPMLRAALEAQRDVLGADHPNTMMTQSNFALLLQTSGKLDEAVELYRDSLQRSVRVNGRDHPASWMAAANLGNALRLRGDLDAAQTQLREAYAGQARHFGATASPTLETNHNLSLALLSAGRADQALRLAEEAWETVRESVVPTAPRSLRTRSRLATMLVRLERFADAEPIAREGLALADETFGPNSRYGRELRSSLADSLEGLGRHEEAVSLRDPAPAPTSAPANSL
jgi:non-specific serine/threonine protein kinase/serine/threonine-protein kinase